MKSNRHYSKAPITEALIDLRVELPTDITLSMLRDIQHRVESDYPVVMELFVAQGQFQAGSEVTATAKQSSIGYRFSSQDGKRIFQARLDGFTFSQLEPYHTWQTLRDEAKRLWEIYASVTQLKTVQRVAVRYINRLDLPVDSSGLLDFKDYLKTAPEIASTLPQDLSDYFMQLQMPQEDLQASLILNEAMLPPIKPDTVSVLLDIDLFSTKVFSSGDNEVWNLLEKFRYRKNEVFEACITDKVRELLR